MKNNYECHLYIQSSLDKVFHAITTEDGLKGWWTEDYQGDLTKVDGEGSFHFDKSFHNLRVIELIHNKKLVWECIDQYHYNKKLNKNDEWIGTKIFFRLSPNLNGGTNIDFTHKGLTENLECYSICKEGWEFYLRKSLKSYIETGVGKPHRISEE